MLLLTTTTDKLQLVTASAVTVDVHASYMDYNGSVVTPGRQNTAISTATTTDIVASPGASTQRNIKELVVRNKHTSTAVDVTALFDQNGTDYELCKMTLAAGEALLYVDGAGFSKLPLSAPVGAWVVVPKTADQTVNNSTVLVDDNTLQFAMEASKAYAFRMLALVTSGPTPDFKYRHTGPASPTRLFIERGHQESGQPANAYVWDVAYSASDVAPPVVSTTIRVTLHGVIHNGSNAGNFKFQWAQNTANASDTKVVKGSYIEYVNLG